VAWGALVVVNTGWPRPAIYGDGWLGLTGAAVPTASMLAVGVLYDRLVRRRRTSGVIAEHRADPPAPELETDTETSAPPAAPEPRKRLRVQLRLRLRPPRLTRPRR
jgi:hypothetical protein